MTRKSFLGIPVEGSIIRGHRVPQRPVTDLQPFLRALLDDDTITEFGWRQYTPYFNDGEPCVFRVGECWVRTTTDAATVDAADLWIGRYDTDHPGLGQLERTADGNSRYQGVDEARYQRAMALATALEDGAFNDVLLETFGDHASVTVRRDGITVDYYEHD